MDQLLPKAYLLLLWTPQLQLTVLSYLKILSKILPLFKVLDMKFHNKVLYSLTMKHPSKHQFLLTECLKLPLKLLVIKHHKLPLKLLVIKHHKLHLKLLVIKHLKLLHKLQLRAMELPNKIPYQVMLLHPKIQPLAMEHLKLRH